jgi:heptosyltransferase-2
VRIGILKPDHFGDLILAAPALAALQRLFNDLVLLCNPNTVKLAAHLFPELPRKPILFPHLDKERQLSLSARPLSACRDQFDLLVCLRWDSYLGPHIEGAGIPTYCSGLDVLDLHVAIEHYQTVCILTDPYDPLTSYEYPFCSKPQSRPKALNVAGLCISAGYALNAWPLNHWLGLAERLGRVGVRVILIGGPCERSRLHILADAVQSSLNYKPAILVGGDDYSDFVNKAADQVDVVVATDSGTAHLLSLACPIISLFGGSPWRRFAPLGAHNAVICRHLPCSPCRQFDRRSINLCQTQECLTNLLPECVMGCLDAYLGKVDFHEPFNFKDVWATQAPWDYQLIEVAKRLPRYQLATLN